MSESTPKPLRVAVIGAGMSGILSAIKLAERGIFAVVFLRLVPVAPFTIINFAAGASREQMAEGLSYVLLHRGGPTMIDAANCWEQAAPELGIPGPY